MIFTNSVVKLFCLLFKYLLVRSSESVNRWTNEQLMHNWICRKVVTLQNGWLKLSVCLCTILYWIADDLSLKSHKNCLTKKKKPKKKNTYAVNEVQKQHNFPFLKCPQVCIYIPNIYIRYLSIGILSTGIYSRTASEIAL